MNPPGPRNKTPDLLKDIFLSDKPYDPCDWTDPRNSFLFEEDGDENPETSIDSGSGEKGNDSRYGD